MTRSLFGTDGVRGKANEEPITANTALALAMAAGAQFRDPERHGLVVIGKDTRLSGYMLEPAMTSGFISVGMDVVLLGPLPTPAVGMLTRSMRADLGVMISASHNPYEDNGIKFFGPDGYKLTDEQELAIERAMASTAELRVGGKGLGRARRLNDAYGRYLEFIKSSFPRALQLDGLKIVVDCAHGAAYKVAPTVLFELGAEVVTIGVSPNGININQGCGATDTAELQKRVVEEEADLGIALDGDADRVILVDEKGRRIDGDQVMALIGTYWHRAERLRGPGVVATLMSNLGLERYLETLGVALLRTPVGDRYVVERMREEGCNLGGEQSGHLIFSDYSTTGDGMIAALQVLAVLVGSGRLASEVLDVFEPLPQLLRNVRFGPGTQPLEMPVVEAAIRDARAALGPSGRLLIRKSGTEPLVRVMGEGEDPDLVQRVVEELAGVIEEATRTAA